VPEPSNLRISPRYTADKVASGAIEDLIDVHEDRVNGFLLLPAQKLLEMPNTGLAVLHLSLSYFEGWEQWASGEDSHNRSKEFFARGFWSVFPSVNWAYRRAGDEKIITDTLYDQLRCGLFHDAMSRRQVVIRPSRSPLAIACDQPGVIASIIVNPELFFRQIAYHFHLYVTELRNPANAVLRANFTRTWERIYSGPPVNVPIEDCSPAPDAQTLSSGDLAAAIRAREKSTGTR
jgi:hypothetical protein